MTGNQGISKRFRFIAGAKTKTWSRQSKLSFGAMLFAHCWNYIFSRPFLSFFCYGVIFFPFPSRVCSMCVLSLCSHRLLSFHPTSNAHYSQTHTRGAYRFGLGSCMRKKKFEVRLRKMGTCVLRFP